MNFPYKIEEAVDYVLESIQKENDEFLIGLKSFDREKVQAIITAIAEYCSSLDDFDFYDSYYYPFVDDDDLRKSFEIKLKLMGINLSKAELDFFLLEESIFYRSKNENEIL